MNVYSIIGIITGILSITFCIATYVKNSKKDVKNETATEQYKQGQLDQQLKNIFEKLDKIESKLDGYDKELDTRIDKAIEIHIKQYHGK